MIFLFVLRAAQGLMCFFLLRMLFPIFFCKLYNCAYLQWLSGSVHKHFHGLQACTWFFFCFFSVQYSILLLLHKMSTLSIIMQDDSWPLIKNIIKKSSIMVWSHAPIQKLSIYFKKPYKVKKKKKESDAKGTWKVSCHSLQSLIKNYRQRPNNVAV